MKKVIIALCFISTFVLAQDITKKDKFLVKQMVHRCSVEQLHAADPACPNEKNPAVVYFDKKIDACTNQAQLVAISNAIAIHR